MRILYFNPETEYALASGASFYTPPGRVELLRIENQLLPEAYARPEDYILVDDPDILRSSQKLVGWKDLAACNALSPSYRPWGWNHALLRRLLDAGVDPKLLPSVDDIDVIRRYSHRRMTVRLNELWNQLVSPQFRVPIPFEATAPEECIRIWRESPGCWMKAPWSSSGRGVINTEADLEERHIRPWCAGIIRRQGSVMIEAGADRIADFASEWSMHDDKASFLGISSFETSRRGKYIRNFDHSQSHLEKSFDYISRIPFRTVVDLQKKISESIFKGYEGPFGIDMIVCRDGMLLPFVEVNLRITMGMVCLESARSLL